MPPGLAAPPPGPRRRTSMSDITLPGAAVRATRRPTSLVRDSLTMAARCVRMSRRNLDALLTSLILPVMLMVMFVCLFGGAIHTGVLLLCAGFGASLTAVSVSNDMTGGIIDRFRSMDIGGAAVLSGHVAASVVRNAASTVLVFGVAIALGFRPHAGLLPWLGAVGVLSLFVVAVSWLSAAAGLLASSPEAASGFTFFVMFLPYPSSAFVPISTMPSWLHGFADTQPVTPVVETLRGLLLGAPVAASAGRALAWCGGILIVSATLSSVLFQRRTAPSTH